MNLRTRHLLAVLVAVVAVGCGDDEKEGEGLPREAVSSLESRLDQIDRRYTFARDNDSPGACADIEKDSFPAIEQVLSDLPDDVDPDMRQATEESFQRLRELTAEDCADIEPQETETTPPETEVETVPPAPPPETESTPPPQTETTPPPDEGDKENNGKGNENGNENGGTPPGPGGGGTQAPQPEGGE